MHLIALFHVLLFLLCFFKNIYGCSKAMPALFLAAAVSVGKSNIERVLSQGQQLPSNM